jgi:hypothetical protein
MAFRPQADFATSAINNIPLLDASFLPSAEDWALLEALNADAGNAGEFESQPEFLDRFCVTATFDD